MDAPLEFVLHQVVVEPETSELAEHGVSVAHPVAMLRNLAVVTLTAVELDDEPSADERSTIPTHGILTWDRTRKPARTRPTPVDEAA